jgi:hypothetical protein
MNRIAGVGLGSVLILLELEVIAQIVELDVTVDDEPFGEILQPGNTQAEMSFGVGDGQLRASLLLAVFGYVFSCKNVTMLAFEGAEEVERPPPPRALAIATSLVSLRRRDAQDARKLGLVLVLHRVWIRIATHAQRGHKSSLYMQLRHTELKDCSLWLRNYRGDAIEITQKTDTLDKRPERRLRLEDVNPFELGPAHRCGSSPPEIPPSMCSLRQVRPSSP